jgi:hypothetical protein
MVSAYTAEVTSFQVLVKGPGGRVIAGELADMADEGDAHGVSRDEADDWLERHGYLAGAFRWQPDGSYYKAVVTPVADYERREAGRAGRRR